MLKGHIPSGPGGASTDEKKSVTFVNEGFVPDDDENRGKGPTPDPQNQDSDINSQMAWDVFTETPADNFSHKNPVLERICMINLKTLVSIFLGLVVLGTALLSRLTFLEIVQQLRVMDIRINRNSSCPISSISKSADVPHGPPVIQIRWIWALFLAVCFPYCTTIFKNIRRMTFKSSSSISCFVLLTDFLIETIHSFGLLVLVFIVLTSIDPARGSMLIYGIGFIPCLLNLFPIREKGSTNSYSDDIDDKVERKSCFVRYSGVISKIALILIFLSLSVLFALFYKSLYTDYSVWPILSKFGTIYYLTPISLIMISFKYWIIFSDRILLREQHKAVHKKKEKIVVLTSILKIGYTLIFIIVLFGTNSECHKVLFDKHAKNATKCGIFDVTLSSSDNTYTPFKYAAINMISGYICYSFARTACQLLIQRISFSLPLILTGPISTILVLLFSTQKFSFFMMAPRGLTPLDYENQFVCLKKYYHDDPWRIFVIGFYLSFIYITRHVWIPKVEKLAKERRLFASTEYCGILTDQSLLLSRRRDKEKKHDDFTNKSEPRNRLSSNAAKMKKMKDIPLIYACATMWHETENEMMQLMKSLFRMDDDQSTRRYMRECLEMNVDYYEFEAHIFFDDAFDRIKGEEDTYRVNDYVKTFMKFLPEACKAVHEDLELGSPRKIMTPYGGRLEWDMPGGNPLVAHLKNKRLIRHKKRWSQVMYMYYFLGQRIAAETLPTTVKSTRFQNTFLLALDGDVDFEPSSVLLLVDRMTRNPDVGAACGRIHPIGTGPMVWYQKFEYAISHWLQKATEHVIGCVLCSPGCFSLFRGSALSSDNVLRRYTTISSEAKHKVQYDQGEDRWLCTLLLQQGYRVEYCAASDALTYCPETFNEFFKQRRRWAPSTMANIMDLLMDWRNVRQKNDSISILYIFYQACLMGASIITPGTILMLIVGALHTAYDITLTQSFFFNLIPIFLMMLLCFTCSEDIQLQFASVMSLLYAMYMMVVIVGLAKEIGEFRQCSTTTLLFGFVCGTFILAAILHPKEIFCLLHGILYFLLIPAMSLLLMFYALGNLQNVSWGTRDSKAEQDAKAEEAKAIAQAKASAKQPGGVMNRLQNIFALRNARDSGSEAEYTFSFGRICRCLCLLKEEKFNTEDALLEVLHTEQEMSKRSTSASDGGTQENSPQNENESNNVSSIEDSTPAKEWTDDEIFAHMDSVSISETEEEFWRNLIKQYLPPEHTDKAVNEEKLKQNLVELRNHVCMFFCLINALFVIIVFTIELTRSNSEAISFRLPWCENTNTKMKQTNIITVVFIMVFGLTLLLQLVAMVFHRYETFLHILASIEINPKMMTKMDMENFVSAFKANDHEFSDACSESTTDTLGTPRPRNHISLFKKKKKRVQSFQEKMDKKFSSVYKRVVENPNDNTPMSDRLSWMLLLQDSEIRRKAEIRMRWIKTAAILRKRNPSKFQDIVQQAQIQKNLKDSLDISSELPDDLQSDDIDDNCIVTGSSVPHGSIHADIHDQARGEPVQEVPDIAGPNAAAPKKSQLSFGRIVDQVRRQNKQRLPLDRSSDGVDSNWIITGSTGSTRADVYDIVDPNTAEADQNGSQWDFIKRKKRAIISAASSGTTPPAPATDAGIDKSSVPSDHQSLQESESGTELTGVSDLENAESVEDDDASTAL